MFVLVIFVSLIKISFTIKAPYESCPKIPQLAEVIDVISFDNANTTTWMAESESTMKANVIFRVNKIVKKPELHVVALLDPTGGPGGRELELVYGKPQDACKLVNNTKCSEEGLQVAETYKLKAVFKTPAALPKISLHVRFIVRESAEKKLTRVQKTNWRRYPGEMVICVLLPVTVVDK